MVICNKFFEYSVEAPTITARVFTLELLGLNTFCKQWVTLVCLDRQHSTHRSCEAQIQWFQSQVPSHPAELLSCHSEAGRLEASLEAVKR